MEKNYFNKLLKRAVIFGLLIGFFIGALVAFIQDINA